MGCWALLLAKHIYIYTYRYIYKYLCAVRTVFRKTELHDSNITAVVPKESKKKKSSNDDDHAYGQKKRRASIYDEGIN